MDTVQAPVEAGRPSKRLPLIIALLVLACGAVVGIFLYLGARHYESTDDAFIDGNISQVAAQVSGRVMAIRIKDNQDVAAGDTLVEIDPSDYTIRLDQEKAQLATARAQLAQAEAQVTLQRATVDQTAANMRVTDADFAKAQQDFARYSGINPAAISRQLLDDAKSAERSARARLDASRQAVGAARAQLVAVGAQVESAKAQLAAAQANVANAELQLSYAHVVAPRAGRVTKRSVEVGNYVTAGTPLLTIVPKEVWVTANFKEIQTGMMHVGQPVEIRIDQYPDLKFEGRIDSFQNGTGAAFSTLPAENATGNYVKVVQRIPVKITFDPHPPGAPDDLRLSPGLSVRPRVKVR